MTSQDDITFKKIVFQRDDKNHSYETDGQSALVVGSTGSHNHGSSKIKLKNFVDYKWEVKNYMGRLIAIHSSGQYLAYAIKVNNKDGRPEGMVRVVKPSNNERALIRGMSNEVLDLQFANLKSQIILAAIEEVALHIHKVESVGESIKCTLMMKIEDPIAGYIPKYDKINWCPYVPENESETDNYVGQLIVWSRGASYQCYSVHSVIETYGIGVHQASDLVEGALKHRESSTITGATLSPDGTTSAISFEDGSIRFYQVYFHTNDEVPRLLHNWTPHNGKPITGLFFLDDHSKHTADNSLWKHAITTSDNNTEIKVWCCATWKCTQTIKFKSTNDNELIFKAEIDPTSSYLVLTDSANRGMYVLQIMQTTNDDAKSSADESKSSDDEQNSSSDSTDAKSMAYVKSVSEFPLSSSILSFGIVSAALRKLKCGYNDMYLLEELDDYDEDSLSRYCVVLHMYLVQPKSVQECHLFYQPSLTTAIELGSTISTLAEGKPQAEELLAECETLSVASDKELNATKNQLDNNLIANNRKTSPALKKTENNLSQQSINSNSVTSIQAKPTPFNLMTPDSFQSSGKITPDGVSNEVYSTLRMLARTSSASAVSPDVKKKSLEAVNLLQLVNNAVIEEPQQPPATIIPPMPPPSMLAAVVSGGSSPSREVQEILSLKETDCLNDFYDSVEIQDETDGSANNGDGVDILDEDEKISNEEEDVDEADEGDEANYNLEKVNHEPEIPVEAVIIGKNAETQSSASSKAIKGAWHAPDVKALSNITTASTLSYKKSTSPINDINCKLDQLLEIIQTQNCQISELKNEVLALKKSHSDSEAKPNTNLEKMTKQIEFSLSKLINEYLIRYEREHNKKLEQFMAGRDAQNRELRESITKVVCTDLTERLTNILVNSIQKHVLPIVAGKLEGIKTQIQSDISQKITITDHVIKENITNICKSPGTLEVFGASVATGVRVGLHQTFTEALKTIILPGYEKANAELFKQLYETFNQGTVAYSNQLVGYTKMYEPIHNELVSLMRSLPDQLRSINDSTVTTCTKQVSQAMQNNLLKTLKENIKSEIQKGFETQQHTLEESVMSAVRSQAQTPAPSIFDIQEQIKHLIYQGQINKAFHQALLANDLSLVEFVLEKADYKNVFNPCPLEQTVLLSLIQQISADMSNHNELKQKYLFDAILNLNLDDPITREHSPRVLKELQNNCQIYAMNNPTSSLVSGNRMIILAVQGLNLN